MSPAAVYGLPAGIATFNPMGGFTWESGSGGATRTHTLTFTPLANSLLVLAGYSNQHSITGVSGGSASWRQIGDAFIKAGAFAISDMWLGYVGRTPGASTTLTVTWEGSNIQGVCAVNMYYVGRKPTVTGSTTNFKSGSGDLTVGPLATTTGRIALASFTTRNGTITVPSGWTALFTGASAGTQILAYRNLVGGESVTATWTAPTDNSAGVVAVLA